MLRIVDSQSRIWILPLLTALLLTLEVVACADPEGPEGDRGPAGPVGAQGAVLRDLLAPPALKAPLGPLALRAGEEVPPMA